MKSKLLIGIILCSTFYSFAQKDFVKSSGDVLLFVMPAAAVGSTLIIGDKKGTWQFLKGFALNEALTYSLKAIVNKERPDMSNSYSFPSGHTSTTFQSASFIQRRYGWRYGVPAYVLASYTGFTRLNTNKHDIVDVLAGALIGIGSTYLFTTPYQKEHMELSFLKGKNSFSICYVFKF
jgi:membrane-associated phospholipid phosphatase